MNKPLRIAFGRINQETNALSPVPTTLADFQATHYFDDDATLLRICDRLPYEVESMFRNAELSGFVQRANKLGVTCVPLISAWAVPGGPLTRACFDALVDRLCEKLAAAGDVDAVYLSLHGAMNVSDLPLSDASTPESEVVRRVRAVVGQEVPIAVSLDLHGNVTRDLVEQSTIIQAYQTNPHRDHAKVGARCAQLLVDTCQGRIRPMMTWRSLPMLLGGGNTVDFLRPMRAIFQRMKEWEERGGILGTSLMMVHPWNRHSELGWAVVVVADGNAVDVAEAAADDLAARAWGVRDQLPPAFHTPDAAIARARKRSFLRKTGVVVFSDASDVVSAGSPGENTLLLPALIGAPDLQTLAALRDPALVGDVHARHAVGSRLRVTLGKKLDTTRGAALDVDAAVVRVGHAHGLGRYVVLQVASLELVVVEGPAMAVKPGFFTAAGCSPWRKDVVVVKNFFPFLLFFAPLLRDVVFVRTAGVTDFDAAFDLDFAGPVHPKNVVDDWREADRRRRLSARSSLAAE